MGYPLAASLPVVGIKLHTRCFMIKKPTVIQQFDLAPVLFVKGPH
jgi:hypothetical protein